MSEIALDRHIEITPGVAGGKPRLAGHGLTVQAIAIRHEHLGRSAEEIAAEHGVGLADVYAALAYYHDHREEIDEAMRSDESFVEELRQLTPSKLPDRLRGR